MNNYCSYGIDIVGSAVSADGIQTAEAEDVSGENLSTHDSTSYGAETEGMLTLVFSVLLQMFMIH